MNGTYILKSGTDFRQFSLLTLDFREVIKLELKVIITKTMEYTDDKDDR